jgi:GTP-binding protein
LIKKRLALVDATPGLTRDRLYAEVDWRGVLFQVVDTGGLQFSKEDRIAKAMEDQVTKAMEESSMALLVCDARAGLVPLDRQVATWARRWGRTILLVVNKVDTEKERTSIYEFTALGVGDPYPVSSLHGVGIGELLDEIVGRLTAVPGTLPKKVPGTAVTATSASEPLRIAIIGRPNVGKSSFVNWLLNEERVLVDESPGTTRDPVEAVFTWKDQVYHLVDTAGIRSGHRLKSKMDVVARLKASEVIRKAHVCLALLEAPHGIIRDDLKLLDQVVTAGTPLCLVVNKWDLIRDQIDPKEVASSIARRAPFVRFAPAICTSAKTGLHVFEALGLATEVAHRARKRMTAAEARRLLKVIQEGPGAPVNIRHSRLLRLTQVEGVPPVFRLFARVRQAWKGTDIAYLEGVIRRQLHIEGVPIRVRLLTWTRGGQRTRR